MKFHLRGVEATIRFIVFYLVDTRYHYKFVFAKDHHSECRNNSDHMFVFLFFRQPHMSQSRWTTHSMLKKLT